jgi:hypothetical protein
MTFLSLYPSTYELRIFISPAHLGKRSRLICNLPSTFNPSATITIPDLNPNPVLASRLLPALKGVVGNETTASRIHRVRSGRKIPDGQ